MKNSKKLLLASIAVVSATIFFAIAFSTADNYFKAICLLADLFLTGEAFHQLTGVEEYYGVLLVRGEAGFRLMTRVAKQFARETRFLADAGLGIAFGLPYLYYASKTSNGSNAKEARKAKGEIKQFFFKALLATLFFIFLFFTQLTATSFNAVIFCIGLLAGLFGIGLFFLAEHAVVVFTVPGAPPGVTLLVPGVTIPFEAVIAIVIVAAVHELAHGVLCKTERLELKSSGLLLFGWLPIGAFVEPNEEKFKKIALHKKRRILVAGSASNILFFIVFLALAFAVSLALHASIQAVSVSSVAANSSAAGVLQEDDVIKEVNGVHVASSSELKAFLTKEALAEKTSVELVTDEGRKKVFFTNIAVAGLKQGFPAAKVLHEKELILGVDGKKVYSLTELRELMKARGEGEEVLLETSEGAKKLRLGKDGKMGVELLQQIVFETRDTPRAGLAWLYALLTFLLIVLTYTYVLNFIVGTVNLLPLFITDGQRMIFEEASARFGKKTGAKISVAAALATIALLAANALPWFLH